jgi:hypothetical protein
MIASVTNLTRIATMKFTPLLTTVVLLGSIGLSQAVIEAVNPNLARVSAQEMKATATTAQEKIAQLIAIKGKPGSAELMRKLYAKDLTPIGIQRGGAGMVVNLYSKADNTTISLCTTFDVIVAAKRGRIAKFAPAEVK